MDTIIVLKVADSFIPIISKIVNRMVIANAGTLKYVPGILSKVSVV